MPVLQTARAYFSIALVTLQSPLGAKISPSVLQRQDQQLKPRVDGEKGKNRGKPDREELGAWQLHRSFLNGPSHWGEPQLGRRDVGEEWCKIK
jgi:hypothetical protein